MSNIKKGVAIVYLFVRAFMNLVGVPANIYTYSDYTRCAPYQAHFIGILALYVVLLQCIYIAKQPASKMNSPRSSRPGALRTNNAFINLLITMFWMTMLLVSTYVNTVVLGRLVLCHCGWVECCLEEIKWSTILTAMLSIFANFPS